MSTETVAEQGQATETLEAGDFAAGRAFMAMGAL